MAVAIVPAFIWSRTLLAWLHHHLIVLGFNFPKPPNIVVDGFRILLCLFTDIFYHERIILVWSMIHNETLFQPYPAPRHYVSLKTNVFYELVFDRSTVLDLIQLIPAIYFFQEYRKAASQITGVPLWIHSFVLAIIAA